MPNTLPVFVYGSLRPTLHNFPMAQRCLVGEPQDARIKGFSLYSNHGDSFPYLARGGNGYVLGSYMQLEDGRYLDRIVGMEIGAGYEVALATVEVSVNSEWQETDALVFVHREEFALSRGELVEDGDWIRYHDEKNPGPRWWEDSLR